MAARNYRDEYDTLCGQQRQEHARIAVILCEIPVAIGQELLDDAMFGLGRIAEIVREGDQTDFHRTFKTVQQDGGTPNE